MNIAQVYTGLYSFTPFLIILYLYSNACSVSRMDIGLWSILFCTHTKMIKS
jgi:hypothetical protein